VIDRVAGAAALAGGLRAIERALGRLDDRQADVEAARATLARLADQAGRLQAAARWVDSAALWTPRSMPSACAKRWRAIRSGATCCASSDSCTTA